MRLSRRAMLALAAFASSARAQEAERPIQLIVPFAPGASSDGLARILATSLGPRLKRTVTPENRPGGGGSVGLMAVARAAPDGATIGIGATGAVAISPHTAEATALRPLEQLTPIARLADIPLVLVASKASGMTTLAEVLARARATPGGLSYGSTGTNSAQHLSIELLKARTGANLVHIPYRGSAPAATDVLTGAVPLASVDLTSAAPHIASGAMVGIGVTSAARTSLAPGIPTLAEGGVPGFVATAWLGLFGPAGLPPALVARLAAEVGAVLADGDERARVLALSCDPSFLPPAAFAAFLAEQSAQWKQAVATLG